VAPSSSRLKTTLRARVSTNASQGYALKLVEGPAQFVTAPGKPVERAIRAPHLTIGGVSGGSGSNGTKQGPAPLGTTIADAHAPPPAGEAQEIDVELVIEADFDIPPGEYTQELSLLFQPRFGPRGSASTARSNP